MSDRGEYLFEFGHTNPPKCCLNCKRLLGERSDIDGIWVHFCEANIFLPYRKLSCKNQLTKGGKGDER